MGLRDLSLCRSLVLMAVLGTAGATACASKVIVRKPADPLLAEEQTIAARASVCAGTCAQAGRLARRLERVHLEMARRAATVSGWKWFLRRHPKGLFVREARRVLAKERFIRAKAIGTCWMWQWFLLQHPASALGAEAERRLHRYLARRLVAHPSPKALRAFLRRYPTAVQRAVIRAVLSRLEFARLSQSSPVWMLETYLREFPGSVHGATVSGWLERRWRSRVKILGTWRALDAYRQRYPASGHLAKLRLAVGREALDRAVVELDPAALRRLASRLSSGIMVGRTGLMQVGRPQDRRVRDTAASRMAREALIVAVRIDRDPKLADRLRRLSWMARPFAPRARLAGLVTAATGGDAAASVAAIYTLAYKDVVAIPGVLLDLSVAGPIASAAWLSLRRWYHRVPSDLARIAIQDLALRYRGDSSLVVARKTVLLLAALRPSQRRILRLARMIPRLDTLTVCAVASAGLAQMRFARRWPPATVNLWVRRCHRSLRQTLKSLSGQIPTELGRPNVPSAVVLLLRLDGLAGLVSAMKAMQPMKAIGSWSSFVARLSETRRRLAARIEEAVPTKDLTVPYSVVLRARRHEQTRKVGWSALLAQRSKLAHIVHAALCRHRGWAPLPCSQVPTAGKGRPGKGRP